MSKGMPSNSGPAPGPLPKQKVGIPASLEMTSALVMAASAARDDSGDDARTADAANRDDAVLVHVSLRVQELLSPAAKLSFSQFQCSSGVACNTEFAAEVDARPADEEGANPDTVHVERAQKVTAATTAILCTQWLDNGRRLGLFEDFMALSENTRFRIVV